jgi:hypothetical protein
MKPKKVFGIEFTEEVAKRCSMHQIKDCKNYFLGGLKPLFFFRLQPWSMQH